MSLFGVGGGISHDLLKKKKKQTQGHSKTDERAYRPGVGWGGGGWRGNGEVTLTGGPGLPSKPEAPWTKGTV